MLVDTPRAHEHDSSVSLVEGVIVTDESFVVQTANDAAADLLGWTEPSELVRHHQDAAGDLFDDDRRQEVLAALEQRGRWSGTAFLERRDGTLFEAFLTACSLHGGDDRDDGSAGVVVTIQPQSAIPFTSVPPAEHESLTVKGLPGRFCLHYQPEFDLRDRSVPSCEALLRWWHPDFGVLSPGPSLSRTKWATRLASVEAWSVLAACRQVAAWEELGRPVQVAINISRHHLGDPELLTRVRHALDATGIDPGRLAVDLPLSAVVKDPVHTREVAEQLDALGVSIIVDGVSGDTPPAALAGLPVRALKFVVGPFGRGGSSANSRAADAAVVLARTLEVLSVAKAVETAADLKDLREKGFDRAFGHVFSPAVPADAMLPLLDRRNGPPDQLAG